MNEDDPRARITAARMRLRDKYLAKMAASPSVADKLPQGSGAPNRHGMPRLPVGQVETEKWPVLDLGILPSVTKESFCLTVDGACGIPLTLKWTDLLAMPQTEDVSDFHCVTTWSRMDIVWRGVRLGDVLAAAQPLDTATHLMCHASDGYTTNFSLVEAMKDDVLLVHTADGSPLSPEHGGPVRVITPQLYAWKGAKWICRLELMTHDKPGYWEERGYSNTAYPWRNDRYS